ncbi:Arginine biosynthesis protein ArgJ, partial [Russula decolorans]
TSPAATFTHNAFQAASVTISKSVLEQMAGLACALIVNSSCTNAVTGWKGLADAWAMAHATDTLLAPFSSPQSSLEMLVMSTGVIDQTLPISKILAVLRLHGPLMLRHRFTAWEVAVCTFMTTDT